MIRGYTAFSGVALKVSFSTSIAVTNPTPTPYLRNHNGPGSSTVNLVFPGKVFTRETFNVTLADFTSAPGYPIETLSYLVSKDSPPYEPIGSSVCYIRGKMNDIQNLNGMKCRIQQPGIYTVYLNYAMKVFTWKNNVVRDGIRYQPTFDGIRIGSNPSSQYASGYISRGSIKYKLTVISNPNVDTNIKPIAVAEFPASIPTNNLINFDGSKSIDPDGSIVFAEWISKSRTPNLGGLNFTPRFNLIVSSGPVVVPATWDVSLTVGDDQGARTTITKPIVVTGSTTPPLSDRPPVAIINTYPGLSGSTTLDATNSYSLNTVIKTEWQYVSLLTPTIVACNTPTSSAPMDIPKTARFFDMNSRIDTRNVMPGDYNFYFTITDNGATVNNNNIATACVNVIVN